MGVSPASRVQIKAATAILRMVQMPNPALGIGPTDAEEIVKRIVKQHRDAVPGGSLEQQRGPAGTQHPVGDLRDFELRRDLGHDALELASTFELRQKSAQIGVAHRRAFSDISRSQTASEKSSSPGLRPRTG